jgi:hypothetical protein
MPKPWLWAFVTLAACGQPSAPSGSDGAATADGGADAGLSDSGSLDGGADSGLVTPPDGGFADAGPDGSAADGGASDAHAEFMDAGSDAGPDAGLPSCTGDAGTLPSARTANWAYFDPVSRLYVSFGGFDGINSYNDTWTFDGCTWSKLSPANSPPARADHGWVYDPDAGSAVMFGGESLTSLPDGDTWLWTAGNWNQAAPNSSPGARLGPGMVWDGVNHRVMVFGGSYALVTYAGDTWEWDDVALNWVQIQTPISPSPRIVESLAFDEQHQQVVLFGGYDGIQVYADTWLWNGVTWTQANPTKSPPARFDHGAAYDPVRRQVVVFGGQTVPGGIGVMNDTWTWDGQNWTQQFPAHSPSARIVHGMVWDDAIGALVFFGGLGNAVYDNETWAWTGADWVQLR